MPTLYDTIGDYYDTTRKADSAIVSILAKELCLNTNGRYLDTGCGTGNYTLELAKYGGQWTGLDCSEKMISDAKQKSPEIQWLVQDVTADISIESSFNGIVCVLSIHHFRDLDKAFGNLSTMQDKGRFVIFTSTPGQMKKYWLNHYFRRLMDDSIRQMPSRELVIELLEKKGYDFISSIPFTVTNELQDFFLYSGNNRPRLYLNAGVRSSISSFRNFDYPQELENGLSELNRDIESGKINKLIRESFSEDGDYTFLVFEK